MSSVPPQKRFKEPRRYHKFSRNRIACQRLAASDFVSSHISFWTEASSYFDQILDTNSDNIDEILDTALPKRSRKGGEST